MEIQRLQLTNFLSFKHLEHDFVKHPVLVQGKNLTDDSKESNGSGKSTMQAGVAYAILATPLKKQVLDRDLIYWGEDSAEIDLTIYCPVRKQTLGIHRVLRTKGSATLELTINDKPVTVTTVLEGNRYILEWIGISPEDLKTFYILNKENYKSFLSASNTDKMALINRFIKVDMLDEADAIVKEMCRPYEDECQKVEHEYAQLQGALAAYEEQLEAEKGRDLVQEQQEQLESIDAEIAAQEDLKRQAGVSLGVYGAKLEELQSKAEQSTLSLKEAQEGYETLLKDTALADERGRLSTSKRAAIDAVNEVNRIGREMQSELDGLTSKESSLKVKLSGSAVCPKCSHRFFLNGDVTVEDVEAQLKKTHEAIDCMNDDMVQVAAAIKECEAELNSFIAKENGLTLRERAHHEQLTSLKKAYQECELESRGLSTSIFNTERDIASMKSTIDTAEATIQKMQETRRLVVEQGVESRVDELEGLVAVHHKKVEKGEKAVEKAREALVEMQQWGQRFKDFKMSLACEQLKVIQDAVNASLQRQKSELRVSIDGFKVDAKGKVKSEITVLVLNGEGLYKNFWSYSGGERCRVEMAFIQAFQEMINSTNQYGGLHFLMVDEVLEGTDPLGLGLLMDSMNAVDYPVYIISHVMNIRAGVPTITVVKRGGASEIEYEQKDDSRN